jgi:N-acetylmuramoyl-L-alanine amidase
VASGLGASVRLCAVVVSLFLSVALPSSPAWGDDTAIFEAVKARYLKLRNTDVGVTRTAEWRAVGADFERFAEECPDHRSAPLALIDGAIVFSEIAKRSGDRAAFERALKLLGRVVSRYPADTLADDALLRRGELLLEREGDSAGAAEAFREVTTRYPESDMVGVARERLRRLEDGEGDEPATERAPSHAGSGPVVVLDPGHGAEDFGAQGPGGILEKDVTLLVARQVSALLKGRGFVVKLTRTDDSFLPLLERTAFANNVAADLFVSIHVNASPEQKLHGVETYYLDTTDGESSRTLAERENSSVRFEGPAGDLAYMLSDLVQSAKTGDSIRLAKLLQTRVVGALRSRWEDVKDLGVKKALFYVLVGAHMPCALIEIGFMDHPIEGKRLATEEYRREIARGIAEAVRGYFESGSTR